VGSAAVLSSQENLSSTPSPVPASSTSAGDADDDNSDHKRLSLATDESLAEEDGGDDGGDVDGATGGSAEKYLYADVIKKPSSSSLDELAKSDVSVDNDEKSAKKNKRRDGEKEEKGEGESVEGERDPRFTENLAMSNANKNTTDSGFYSVKGANSDSDEIELDLTPRSTTLGESRSKSKRNNPADSSTAKPKRRDSKQPSDEVFSDSAEKNESDDMNDGHAEHVDDVLERTLTAEQFSQSAAAASSCEVADHEDVQCDSVTSHPEPDQTVRGVCVSTDKNDVLSQNKLPSDDRIVDNEHSKADPKTAVPNSDEVSSKLDDSRTCENSASVSEKTVSSQQHNGEKAKKKKKKSKKKNKQKQHSTETVSTHSENKEDDDSVTKNKADKQSDVETSENQKDECENQTVDSTSSISKSPHGNSVEKYSSGSQAKSTPTDSGNSGVTDTQKCSSNGDDQPASTQPSSIPQQHSVEAGNPQQTSVEVNVTQGTTSSRDEQISSAQAGNDVGGNSLLTVHVLGDSGYATIAEVENSVSRICVSQPEKVDVPKPGNSVGSFPSDARSVLDKSCAPKAQNTNLPKPEAGGAPKSQNVMPKPGMKNSGGNRSSGVPLPVNASSSSAAAAVPTPGSQDESDVERFVSESGDVYTRVSVRARSRSKTLDRLNASPAVVEQKITKEIPSSASTSKGVSLALPKKEGEEEKKKLKKKEGKVLGGKQKTSNVSKKPLQQQQQGERNPAWSQENDLLESWGLSTILSKGLAEDSDDEDDDDDEESEYESAEEGTSSPMQKSHPREATGGGLVMQGSSSLVPCSRLGGDLTVQQNGDHF
jgi:hypothetical protein